MNSIFETIEEKLSLYIKSAIPSFYKYPYSFISASLLFIFIFSFISEHIAIALTAFGTVSAVIWALYHQELKNILEKPMLKIENINLTPPYFRSIKDNDNNEVSYYINIPLLNIGKKTAINCTPILTSIFKFENNSWHKVDNWIPLPLLWAADEMAYTDIVNTGKEYVSKMQGVERNILPHRPYFFNLGKFYSLNPSKFDLLTAFKLIA